jgi:5'-nucleotidase
MPARTGEQTAARSGDRPLLGARVHRAKHLLNSNRAVPTFLLTNDDGWDGPGLEALRQAARGLGDCRVIAPEEPQSGCGHRATTHGPIRLRRPTEDHVAVAGTPVDCVRLALHHFAPAVGWVLSGINPGGNLGTDIYHSGTVAAVREGVIRGVPGIAVSHYIARGRAIDWSRAALWTREILILLMARAWVPGTFWNVNLPHPGPEDPDPEVVFCPLDPSPLPLSYDFHDGQAIYAGEYQSRIRRPGCDVDICFRGQIAVTSIHVAGNGAP